MKFFLEFQAATWIRVLLDIYGSFRAIVFMCLMIFRKV